MATDSAALMIDSVFLAKLIASDLYGPPVEGLSDRLKERAPNGLTERALLDAAEVIMRAHGSGAFPKLPACLRAIEEASRTNHVAPVDGRFAASGITKENYSEMAIAHCKKVGVYTVIERERDIEEWAAWRAYYAELGMKGSALYMIGAAKWTVPAKLPQHFDVSYRPKPSAAIPARNQERTAA